MRTALLLLLLASPRLSALDYETDARLRMAHQIARERNDADLVKQVTETAKVLESGVSREETETRLRAVESAVGIDAGGWAMAGQPLFRPSPERESAIAAIGPRFKEALASGSVEAVKSVTADWLAVLGDQAGLPDGRRAGTHPGPLALDEAGATRLFLDAIGSEARAVRELSASRPLPGQMLRFYGYLLEGLATIRPHAEQHLPGSVAQLDELARGIATILTERQQPAGHFPFPDLRGRNLRFGAMIEKGLAAGTIEVRDGWMISIDPDGGSQFDTGICGIALLRAGQIWEQPDWIAAGLRAAEWAQTQAVCANFNYNAFSVSLLCEAGRVSGKREYLDAALAKFRVGVAPGQAPNGRWLDSHNARTVYHLIILRAIGDLMVSLPPDSTDHAEVKAIADPAIAALLDEFDAMGITVECLPELIPLLPHVSEADRLRSALDRVAASLVEKSTDGTRVRLGAQPHQLAAVADWLAR